MAPGGVSKGTRIGRTHIYNNGTYNRLSMGQLDRLEWRDSSDIDTGIEVQLYRASSARLLCTAGLDITTLQVGGGTLLTLAKVYLQGLTPSSVSANTTSEQPFTVTGLTAADKVFVNKPSHQAGLGIVNARVSSNNTIAITFMNNTGSAITPTSETYQIFAIRS